MTAEPMPSHNAKTQVVFDLAQAKSVTYSSFELPTVEARCRRDGRCSLIALQCKSVLCRYGPAEEVRTAVNSVRVRSSCNTRVATIPIPIIKRGTRQSKVLIMRDEMR